MSDTKSLVAYLIEYVDALFLDIAPTYRRPSDWRRDKQRLRYELGYRGSRVATLDLPALGKHFDKCLDQGQYVPSNLFLGGMSRKGVGVPVFMRDLYLQVFDTEGKLRGDASLEAVAHLRTVFMSLKKLRLTCSKERTNDAVKDFIAVERSIQNPSYRWNSEVLLADNDPRPHFGDLDRDRVPGPQLVFWEADREIRSSVNDLETLQQVCDRVSSQFGDLHVEGRTELPKHGPGVVANLRRGTSKFQFPEWSTKVEAIFPQDLYGSTRFGVPFDPDHGGVELCSETSEHYSKLIAVPKTMKGPRLIAAEPVQHQWLQQLVRNQLESRLSSTSLRSCIFFRSQEVNGSRAVEGSLSGNLATIDLSSASDRLSCWTVERTFRANFTILERLHACRTRWLRNVVDPYQDEYLILKKFAPQGSAVTFPVQSIVYACVAIASVILSKGERVTSRSIESASRQVSVFGDDIIVPKDACRYTFSLLHDLGLKVNEDKTFFEGNFRESCGFDAFRGEVVTPPYLAKPGRWTQPNELESFIEIANNYFRKGYWHVASWLDAQYDRLSHRIPVVRVNSDRPGKESFCGAKLDHLQKRWSKSLHREEVRTVTFISKVPILPTTGRDALFQYFIENPDPQTKWESGTRGIPVSTMRLGWIPVEMFEQAVMQSSTTGCLQR